MRRGLKCVRAGRFTPHIVHATLGGNVRTFLGMQVNSPAFPIFSSRLAVRWSPMTEQFVVLRGCHSPIGAFFSLFSRFISFAGIL